MKLHALDVYFYYILPEIPQHLLWTHGKYNSRQWTSIATSYLLMTWNRLCLLERHVNRSGKNWGSLTAFITKWVMLQDPMKSFLIAIIIWQMILACIKTVMHISDCFAPLSIKNFLPFKWYSMKKCHYDRWLILTIITLKSTSCCLVQTIVSERIYRPQIAWFAVAETDPFFFVYFVVQTLLGLRFLHIRVNSCPFVVLPLPPPSCFFVYFVFFVVKNVLIF